MEHTSIVTASELEEYAQRRDSESVIPELVYLLVTRSVADLTECRIPYGDSINLTGFDGLVRTESGFRQFVPRGTSYWEIGRSGDPQKKATDDYRKRTAALNAEIRKLAAYVFVTPHSRAWAQKQQAAWLKRRQEGGWRELKIVDGVQLADWLREFPTIAKWLLKKIGLVKGPAGFETAAEHWALLSESRKPTDPPLPAKVFLIGRDKAAQDLERLFRGEVSQLVLGTESEHDAADFVAAFLEASPPEVRTVYANQCLFVNDADAWLTFTELRSSWVLLASPRLDLETNEQLHMAAKNRGHRIIIPVSGTLNRPGFSGDLRV